MYYFILISVFYFSRTFLLKTGAHFWSQAMGQLAAGYRDGSGVSVDLDLATKWFERAADFTVEAMYQSYLMYSQNTSQRGANGSRAELFLERAARMGHEEAMRKFVEPLAKAKRWEDRRISDMWEVLAEFGLNSCEYIKI